MLRKLVVAMTIAGAVNYANALGLGEIRLKSALNQPLDAEIELVQVRNLSSNEILPNLATREDFRRAGVERPFFLSGLKFRSIVRPDGTAYIRITSERAVQEPFINFLVEVHWPRGRLLREYTLLVDPPVFGGDRAAPVNVPVPGAPVAAVPSPNASRPQSNSPYPAPTPPSGNARQQEGKIYRQPQQASGAVAKPLSSNYYRVGPNDSLWNIANRIRPDNSVNLQQTMVAIQRANPRAFMNGNINRLMKGQVLRLPSKDEILAVRQGDARQAISRQNDQWQGKSQQIDATPRSRPEAAPSTLPPPESQLKIVNAVDEEQGQGGVENNTGAAADSRRNNSDLENRLTMAMERMDRLADENEDLTSRLTDLDTQIKTLEKLISLKDEQLAMLQSELAKRDKMLAEARKGQPVAATGNVPQQTAPAAKPKQEIDYNYQSGPEAAPANNAQTQQPETAPGPKPKPKPKPRPQVNYDEPVYVDEGPLSNPLYLGGLGALLLALVGMLVYRNRKNAAETPVKAKKDKGSKKKDKKVAAEAAETGADSDSEPASEKAGKKSFLDGIKGFREKLNTGISLGALAALFSFGKKQDDAKPLEEEDENAPVPLFADLPDTPQVAETGLQQKNAAKPAPVKQETVAEPEADTVEETEEETVEQQTDDVLSEADIYLAYGRLPQASNLLLEAIGQEPDRSDLRLKLMQVYAQGGETEKFETQLNELKALGDEAALAKADELRGHFPEGLAAGTGDISADTEFALSEEDLADIELDLDAGESSGSEQAASAEATDAAPADELDDLDLSFEDLELDVNSLEAEADPPLTDPLTELEEPSQEPAETEVVPDEQPAASISEMEEIPSVVPEQDQAAAGNSDDFDITLDSMEMEDLDLDLDLSLDDELTPETPDNAADQLDDLEALQGLDDLELDEAVLASGDDASLDDLNLDVDLDQLNHDLDQLSDEIDGTGSTPVDSQGFGDNISELDELSLELDEDLVNAPAVEGLNLDDELPTFEADDAELALDQEEAGDDFQFLAGTDEAATKLDLARAYMDMGDAEGAKEILGEVLQEGDEAQQKEARDLLTRLDS
ncbi:FimV/HubP family polar landmark protein [Endozoicomonadaceae bacterium StTr2]